MKNLKHFFLALLILILSPGLLVFWALHSDAVAVVLLAVLNGGIYHQVGTVTLHYEKEDVTVPVYKSHGKPFLLVGPHEFYAGDTDFLFVSPNTVVATVTDKGGGGRLPIFGLLFMEDDMTDRDRLRMPFWNLLSDNTSPGTGVRRIAGCREYIVTVGSEKTRELRFCIPDSLFTLDMPPGELYLDGHFYF